MDSDFGVLGRCCSALVATPPRLARPRAPDHKLLARLSDSDAGVPSASRAVTLTPLVQTQRSAPTMVIAEGVFRPPQLTLGMTSFLVEHPKARFVVDPAVSADVHRTVLPELPWPMRPLVAPDKPVTGLPEVLDRAGVTPDRLQFALPTHLHWDHVAGLSELAKTLLVHTTPVEHSFAHSGDHPPPGVARSPLRDRRVEFYELDGPPVLTFASSHDLFGDGSVLVVDLAGHTPGHVGVLLHLGDQRRVLLAGDAAWSLMQVTRLRAKAPLPGWLVDADRRATFATLHRLHALPREIEVIASHAHAAATRFRTS